MIKPLIIRNKFNYDDNIMIRFLQAFFYPLLSAVLMSVGISNEVFSFGFPFAGLISLVPLYISLSQAKSFKTAGFRVSLVFGLVHIFSSFWLANFGDYAIFTLGASAAAYFVVGFVFGQIVYIPFFFSNKKANTLKEAAGLKPFASVLRILLFTSVWTFHEWFKSIGFLAYPWGTLIMTAYKWHFLTQIVSLTGTWGISFLFSMFSAVCGEGIYLLSRYSRGTGAFAVPYAKSYACTAAACIILFCCSVCYGFYEVGKERTPIKTMDTILVQHNVDSWVNDNTKSVEIAIELTRKAAEETKDESDLVVWSESILTYLLPETYNLLEFFPEKSPLLPEIRKTGIPFLFGAPYTVNMEKLQFSNSAVLLNPDATEADHYGKIQLVPFAEYIPYSDREWMRDFMQKIAGFSSGWIPGNRYTIFTIPIKAGGTVSFSAPICFEDAFPEVCRKLFQAGSEVFINLTNDSWSKTASAEYQHFVIASYRALEYRTTLVRCTNSGMTAVVDPSGRILWSLPLFERASGQVSIPIFEREMTVYAMLGDWLPITAALFVALTYIVFFIRKKFRPNSL